MIGDLGIFVIMLYSTSYRELLKGTHEDRIISFYLFKSKQKVKKTFQLHHVFPIVTMHTVRYNALLKHLSLP